MSTSPRWKAALLSFLTLWVVYFMLQLIDIMIFSSILTFLYELIIGNALILYNYSFGIFRYSLPYIFFFFIFCIFNLRYKGYVKFKFFGIDLQQYNSKITYLVFFFKEYNYWILLTFNLFFILLIFYYLLHKKFLLIFLILSFYTFIGLSIYIKRWLIKKNYFNKAYFNVFINLILVSVASLYLSEVGDSIEQYVGFKMNMAEFFYGFFKKKDKFLFKLSHDSNNYKWWRILDLYKNQKSSLNYIYLKKQILNKNLLNDLSNTNKSLSLNKENEDHVQLQNINNINVKNNNVYTDKNIVYYDNAKFENHANLFKNINYYKYLENKQLRLYLLNMKGITAGDLAPRGIPNKVNNLIWFLNKDKEFTINNLNKVLLNKNMANKWNTYYLMQYQQHNKQQHFFNILFNKNISYTTKNLFFFKFTKNSIINLIKQQDNIIFKNNKLELNKISREYVQNIKSNNIILKYNYFLTWWEKKNYIVNNFFKGYNVKKYSSLTKYNFQGKNALFNLFQKDKIDQVLKPVKIGKIHDVKFKLKLINYLDRNILYVQHLKTTFDKNIKVLVFSLNKTNINKIQIQIFNEGYNYIMANDLQNNKIFIGSLNLNNSYNPTVFETYLSDLASKHAIFKFLYLKLYPVQLPEYYNFQLKNTYSSWVLYSENNGNTYLSTKHTQITNLNLTEYQKVFRSFSIYNNFVNKYFNFNFNNKMNYLEFQLNNTKKIFSIFFKDHNYNNNRMFSLFKYTYSLPLNSNLDYSESKDFIIKIAENIDTTDSGDLYFKQFLLKKVDFLAIYFSSKKMCFGEFINSLQKIKVFFNKYAIWELKQKETYNFKSLKNPYLDRSIYWKEYFKAQKLLDYELMYSCPEEKIVAEKLTMVHNRMNVCNFAYDTRTAMLNENLDEYIDELEDNLLLEGELKSCERTSEYIRYELNAIYEEEDLALIDLVSDYRRYEAYVKEWINVYQANYDELEQKKRVFTMVLGNYEAELDKLSPEDIQEIKEAIEFDKEEALDTLWLESELGVLYYKIEIFKDKLQLLDEICCEYEDLLEEVIAIRDEDQQNLMFEINNKLDSLKKFSENRNLFLLEQKEQEALKEALKKNAFQNSLIKKDWDLYNKNRSKNEIILFKNKK